MDTVSIRKLKPSRINGKIDTSSFNKDTKEVNVVFGTENLILERFADGEPFYERILMRNAAADLNRFNNGAAVLDNHNSGSIKNQLGKVVRAWIDEATKEGYATLKLSDSKDWESVVNDIEKGIITNISFVARRKKVVNTGTEKDGIPILETQQWEGLEISFVTIPADADAGVRSKNLEDFEIEIINHQKNIKMLTPEQKETRKNAITDVCRKLKLTDEFALTLISDEEITLDAARGLAIDEAGKIPAAPAKINVDELEGKDKSRALEIIGVCRKLGLSDLKNKEGVSYAEELIGQKITLDAARALAIDKAAELQNININSKTNIGVKNDNVAKRAECMENALLERVGITKGEDGKKLETDVYRNLSLAEIAVEHAISNGTLDVAELGRRSAISIISDKRSKELIFGISKRESSGLLTTSDFPALMENVLNKILRNSYTLADKTWDVWTKKTTANDFKPMSRPILHDVFIDPDKDVVNEGAEYTLAKMTDATEKYSVRKWGKKIPFSWEAIINDDLSALDRTMGSVSAGFTQAQNRMVYRTLTNATALADKSNVMNDNQVIFYSAHNNIISTGTSITLTDLQNMRTKLRTQTAPNGNKLNLKARFLVVGPLLETLAEQFTSANFTPNQSGVINKFGPTLTPVVDANITDTSWYIIADPSTIDTIEVASIGGQDMYAESRYSFDIDGIESKVRMTFGLKALDFRGMVKNVGA